MGEKSKNIIRKSGKAGPFLGSLLGIFPQCGFSVSATNLYAGREIVYLAYEAVFSEYFHRYPTYLNLELPVGKNTRSERRITEACKYVKSHSKQSDDIEKSDELLKYFEKN